MIDLTQEASETTATVIAVTPRRTGEEDEKLVADVTLAVVVITAEDAAVVQRFVPGAVDYWDRSDASRAAAKSAEAVEGAAAAAVASSGLQAAVSLRETAPTRYAVTLTGGDEDDGKVFVSSPGELRAVRLAATPRGGVVLSLRVRLDVPSPADVGRLAAMLEQDVEVAMKRVQMLLKFPDRPRSEVDDLVVYTIDGIECAGRVVSLSEDGGEIEVDDFGERANVAQSAVTSCVRVAPPSGYTLDQIEGYIKRVAKSAKAEPSWVDVVVSVGSAVAAGEVERAGDRVVLSTSVVDAAYPRRERAAK